MLKTKNLTDFRFRTIRQIRTKAVVETRIEHAEVRHEIIGADPRLDDVRPILVDPCHRNGSRERQRAIATATAIETRLAVNSNGGSAGPPGIAW